MGTAYLNELNCNKANREATAKLLMVFGKNNPMELFTDLLQQHAGSWSEYASLCQWLLLPELSTELG